MPMTVSDDTPRVAAERLYALCDELERRQVPADQVEELRALSDRFTRHIQGLPVFWERLKDYAWRQGLCS